MVTTQLDTALARLDAGEREAILLAESLGADLVVLDDRSARRVAIERGLTVTGLLGVLNRAATQGLIDFPNTIKCLQETTFRASPGLLQLFLNRYRRNTETE